MNLTILVSLFLGVGHSHAANPIETLRLSREHAGTPMTHFVLPTVEGQIIRSEDFAGRVVILNFWATWCGPCKDEMPALARLDQRFNQEDFLLLTITTDLQTQAIKTFLEILNIDIPVLLDEHQEVSHAYMARALPLTVVIDRDGRLIGKAMGPREWDSPASMALIQQLLDGITP